MKPEEFFKNLLLTAAIILLCSVFVSLFVMALLIQADENLSMSNDSLWAIGIVAFLATAVFLIVWVIERIFPAAVSGAVRKARRSNPYSFSAIAKRRIKRRFEAAKRRRLRAQPVRTNQYRQSFGSASRLIQ